MRVFESLIAVASSLSVLTSIACTTVPEVEPRDREHMLVMDTDGAIVSLRETQRATVRGQEIQVRYLEHPLGCEDEHAAASVGLCDVLRGLDEDFATDQELDIFIFAHGGLNSYDTSISRVSRHLRAMAKSADSDPKSEFYPLFLVWNSDGLGSYGDHLWRVRRGAVLGMPAHLTSPGYAAFDVVSTAARLPESWFVQGFVGARSLYFNSKNPCLHVEPPGPRSRLRHRVVVPPRDECGGVGRFAPSFIPLQIFKLVTTPIADSMGGEAWNVMKRRADLLVRNSVSEDDDSYSGSDVGGVGALLLEVSRRLEDGGAWSGGSVRITLAGHSMGTFIVNNIVRKFPDLPIKKIVHMAAADTLRSLDDAIVPYLQSHQGVEFYSLMLHPEREDREWHFLNVIPSGSLLTWIDNLYEHPPTRLDRTAGRWDNVRRWMDRLPEGVEKQMCFRVFPYDRPDLPTEHGEFDDLNKGAEGEPQYWEEDFWTGGGCRREMHPESSEARVR